MSLLPDLAYSGIVDGRTVETSLHLAYLAKQKMIAVNRIDIRIVDVSGGRYGIYSEIMHPELTKCFPETVCRDH